MKFVLLFLAGLSLTHSEIWNLHSWFAAIFRKSVDCWIAEDMPSQKKDVLRTASKYSEREYGYHSFVTVLTSVKESYLRDLLSTLLNFTDSLAYIHGNSFS
ncbi:hypothetical protein ANCCAN_09015 [Ancylostoma caninum]|uniref:Uncharacterized protein n=1 Tax=Ancylostoma caninum TaxID=29170 RepID=A0A368GKR9_ANCCA|nr:hypothetical protein ANCCAN_09015 [Ancylostoma caninum]